MRKIDEAKEPKFKGIEVGHNLYTMQLQERAREGKCLTCGGMLCEHRLQWKVGARRF